MSKGVAALSMDKKFIQGRQRQVCLKLLYTLVLNIDNALAFKKVSYPKHYQIEVTGITFLLMETNLSHLNVLLTQLLEYS